MKRVREKLKSNSGLTAIFALGAFLFATLVSVAIIDAAMNNAKRVEGQLKEQASNMIVTSGATLLRQTLEDQSITIIQKLSPVDESVELERTYGDGSSRDLLTRALADAILDWRCGGGGFPCELSMKVDGAPEMDLTVVVMYDGSRLSMALKPADEEAAKTAKPMTLVFDGAQMLITKTPIYKIEYVQIGTTESGEPIVMETYVLDYWEQTSMVGFSAGSVRVEAKGAE
ncbi:MAG: hypothetical protein J5449_06350 [Oscillospiraceae bacterium]|nr:hypothetical protein [Oscillospiraceae bacterium]